MIKTHEQEIQLKLAIRNEVARNPLISVVQLQNALKERGFQTYPWRIDKVMRRWESGITLDSALATGRKRSLLVMQIRQEPVPADVLPIRREFDGRYSTAGNQIVSSPDRPWSRIGSGRGTRAAPCRSVALQTDAELERKAA